MFFQQKLKINQGFAELLNDIGISKKVFLDNEEAEEEEENEYGEQDDNEHMLYQDAEDIEEELLDNPTIDEDCGEEEIEDEEMMQQEGLEEEIEEMQV